MPINTADLQAALDAAVAEAERTTTTEEGAGSLIASLAAANATAIQALVTDNAISQEAADKVTAALKVVTKKFADGDDKLGAAIVAGTPVIPSQTKR